MLTIRKSADRGRFNMGWLETAHTFSFGRYVDRAHMGFRALRVINEDVVAPSRGFAEHEHDNMEIVTYPLSGTIRHGDSLGNREDIAHGMIQRMTAGSGIRHSEANPSTREPVHLLQIWLLPDEAELPPSHESVRTRVLDEPGRLHLLGSVDGREGSVRLHSRAELWAGVFGAGDRARFEPKLGLGGRGNAWVQVARGSVRVNGQVLEAGDGAALTDEREVELSFDRDAEVLVFDLE